nr:hypothetical protein [Tanacetum cinerariifolium]
MFYMVPASSFSESKPHILFNDENVSTRSLHSKGAGQMGHHTQKARVRRVTRKVKSIHNWRRGQDLTFHKGTCNFQGILGTVAEG